MSIVDPPSEPKALLLKHQGHLFLVAVRSEDGCEKQILINTLTQELKLLKPLPEGVYLRRFDAQGFCYLEGPPGCKVWAQTALNYAAYGDASVVTKIRDQRSRTNEDASTFFNIHLSTRMAMRFGVPLNTYHISIRLSCQMPLSAYFSGGVCLASAAHSESVKASRGKQLG